jgi:hypothetical protein
MEIEIEKYEPGPVIPSMFAETWESDVYIADLTNNNPNVYLELGVRWAMKDNLTILVSQNAEEIGYNVSTTAALVIY